MQNFLGSGKSHPQHLTAVRTWHQATRPLRWPQQRVFKTLVPMGANDANGENLQ